MALGGGTWLAQNKILPGSYINFISASNASATLSDRGTATVPIELDWGAEGEVFTVTSGEFQKNSVKIFGHAYTADEMLPMREIFAHASTVHFFRLNSGGTKASNAFAEAKYPGSLGNEIKIVIEKNDAYEEDAENPDDSNLIYDVSTYLGTTCMETQEGITSAAGLSDNDYVSFNTSATLTFTASSPLEGGSDGTVDDSSYQTYLDRIESYSFNTMCCPSADDTVKSLFVSHTKRKREEEGVKFQTVIFRYSKADYEGIISVENGLKSDPDNASLVYWTTGASAGCAVNKSLTNTSYDGELDFDTDYTQKELESAIQSGKMIFHRVDDETRLLTDINTFVSVTDDKSADFSMNQTVRVLDQIGNDIAVIFNTKYLGKVPNDNAGRISLWNDIVKHHDSLQTIRAIENFSSSDITVEAGDTKKSVVVTDYITPVNAMEQLFMQVIVQ